MRGKTKFRTTVSISNRERVTAQRTPQTEPYADIPTPVVNSLDEECRGWETWLVCGVTVGTEAGGRSIGGSVMRCDISDELHGIVRVRKGDLCTGKGLEVIVLEVPG